jgi:DNA-binding transcriptional LysR family regulator
LRLASSVWGNFGNRYVVPLIAGFCSRYPEVTVDYSTSQHAPDLLAAGIDVSIYLTRHRSDSGLVAVPLGTTFSVLCAAPAYLELRGIPDHPRELANHACIRLINPSASTEWELTSGKRSYQVQPDGPVIGDHPDVPLSAAVQASGVAFLPFFTVIDCDTQQPSCPCAAVLAFGRRRRLRALSVPPLSGRKNQSMAGSSQDARCTDARGRRHGVSLSPTRDGDVEACLLV